MGAGKASDRGMAMPDELRYEIRQVTLGRAWVSDATLAVISGELDSGERVVAALTNSGGNTLFATNRRVIVANERNIIYECPHDAITEVEAKTGFLTQGVNLRSDKRAYLYRTGGDKEGPVEMAAAIRRLMAGSAPDDDHDAGNDEDAAETAVALARASAIGRLADAYIGVATPSRAEVSALPGLLAEGEQVALIANCRREWDYGALVATDARALFVSEGEDGAVVAASWPHDLVDRVEIGAARISPAYVQQNTSDGVVRIDIDSHDIVASASWQHDLIGRVEQGFFGEITIERILEGSIPQLHTAEEGSILQLHTADGVVEIDIASWRHDLIERVEQGVVGDSLAYIQLHTADWVVQIDALDIDCARQAAEFLQSKANVAARAAAVRESADAYKSEGAPTADQVVGAGDGAGDGGGIAAGASENQVAWTSEQAAGAGDSAGDEGGTAAGVGENQVARTGDQAAGAGDGAGDEGGAAAGAGENQVALTSEQAAGAGENQGALAGEQAAQLQSIEALLDSVILTAEEFEQMRARIYERGAERAAQLQSIEALRDSGILTAEEFERMRARIYETG